MKNRSRGSNRKSEKEKTLTGKRTRQILMSIWEPLNILGRGLMGDLWITVYLSLQDAIALSILLRLPSLIGRTIIGKDFSSFKVCLCESPWGISFYACFVIIIADFCLWVVLAGRIIARFITDILKLRRGNGNGSSRT